MQRIEIGDLVECYMGPGQYTCGVVVGFNKKGEGGRNIVHVLCNDIIEIMMHYDIRRIGEEWYREI